LNKIPPGNSEETGPELAGDAIALLILNYYPLLWAEFCDQIKGYKRRDVVNAIGQQIVERAAHRYRAALRLAQRETVAE